MRFVTRGAGPGLVLALLTTLVGCNHLHQKGDCGPDCGPDGGTHCHPSTVCKNPTVMNLADDLDHLERHIDWYGSVVAKVPDVWGEARLTVYREQFEKLMDPTDPINKLEFVAGLQGSLARSDQAFFAHATALSIAAQPKGGGTPALIPTGRETILVNNSSSNPTSSSEEKANLTAGTDANNKSIMDTLYKTGTSDTTQKNSQVKTTEGLPTPTTATPAVDAKTLLTDPDNAIKRELISGRTVGFGNLKTGGIGIEPTLMVAQKKRYLDFLNQLRRENEGDDTADSPGYSLNLVRIPVSVLPGKRTDVGHGAEITMTMNPILGNDLLPATFRNLVGNDLRHQLGVPLTQFLNDKEDRDVLTEGSKNHIILLPIINRILEIIRMYPDDATALRNLKAYADKEWTTEERYRIFELTKQPTIQADHKILFNYLLNPTTTATATADASTAQSALKNAREDSKSANDLAIKIDRNFTNKLKLPSLSFSPGITNKTGFPTSQLIDVYGLSNCFQIAYAANAALSDSIVRQGYAHQPDVQGFLQQETVAAYRFLAEAQCRHLWTEFCTQDMVTAVRTRKLDWLQDKRHQYREMVKNISLAIPGSREKRPFNEHMEYSTTAALAWCILVDSALLNDRLMRDIREVSSARNKPLAGTDHWHEFFLPDPPHDCRCAFNAYVALRWPIHVFALDPYTQDQNIADQLSSRREMQLALSIAFTKGMISANSLTKYTRRLEAEYESVQLNRTQVGFSHGENTFGWRFYPRFQSPDTESNLKVLGRDLFWGGPNRNALLRQRRLEPGPRECVAIVLMPSFVPYATVDTVGNWFGLANPKHKVLDHTQAMKMSHTVQSIKTCGPSVGDAACYREGDFDRLMRRAQQLEERLPTQTLSVPVPVLNTLGGFEMFANGTTDLAPELDGWYGAPGLSTTKATTLFLVGDHFSALRTRVVVGNTAIDPKLNQQMLSRQVMQVTVPANAVIPIKVKEGKTERLYVTAHVATPYGVTRELLIPVVDGAAPAAPAAPAEGYTLKPNEVSVTYQMKPSVTFPGGSEYVEVSDTSPARIIVDWTDNTGSVPNKLDVTFVFEWNGKEVPIPARAALRVEDGGISTFIVDKTNLKSVADKLIRAIQVDGLKAGANPFDAPFTTKRVEVTPVVDKADSKIHAVQTKTATNQLKLVFTGQYVEPKPMPVKEKEVDETTSAIPPSVERNATPALRVVTVPAKAEPATPAIPLATIPKTPAAPVNGLPLPIRP